MTNALDAADAMDAGSIHIEQRASLPRFLQCTADPLLKGWSIVGNPRSTLEAESAKQGWICFFMAGRIEGAAFGFNRRNALGAAVRHLAKSVKSAGCNSFEVLQVSSRQFLGVYRVTVAAHARHLQKGLVCFGQ
jgi:hypothetical protein